MHQRDCADEDELVVERLALLKRMGETEQHEEEQGGAARPKTVLGEQERKAATKVARSLMKKMFVVSMQEKKMNDSVA